MIEDSEPHTVLNVKEILAFSSNIGTIKIAEFLGKKSIYNQAREFGYGTKTGFDSFTEQPGTFREPSKWTLSSCIVFYGMNFCYSIANCHVICSNC